MRRPCAHSIGPGFSTTVSKLRPFLFGSGEVENDYADYRGSRPDNSGTESD